MPDPGIPGAPNAPDRNQIPGGIPGLPGPDEYVDDPAIPPLIPNQQGGGGGGDDDRGGGGDDDREEFSLEELARKYPMWAPWLSNEEIAEVLQEAAREGYDSATLRAEIMATNWWRETDASRRQAIALRETDPAEWEREVQVRIRDIRNMVGQAGITLSRGQIRTLAEGELLNGWTDAELNSAITGLVRQEEANIGPGQITQWEQDVRELARSFHWNINDNRVSRFALGLWEGTTTLDAVRTLAMEHARSRFGWMDDHLQRGLTPDDYFAPIVGEVARTLEMNPADIDLTDPMWMGLTETTGEDGARRPRTMTEAIGWARTHMRDQWEQTVNYNQTTQDLAAFLRRKFGKVA